MNPFSTTFQVSWSNLDSNNHMANSAYGDKQRGSRCLWETDPVPKSQHLLPTHQP
jgi:hypothetical protein